MTFPEINMNIHFSYQCIYPHTRIIIFSIYQSSFFEVNLRIFHFGNEADLVFYIFVVAVLVLPHKSDISIHSSLWSIYLRYSASSVKFFIKMFGQNSLCKFWFRVISLAPWSLRSSLRFLIWKINVMNRLQNTLHYDFYNPDTKTSDFHFNISWVLESAGRSFSPASRTYTILGEWRLNVQQQSKAVL
jgi:hypothetical protein